jgi:peptidoglycan/xylan/chitin deacetylase (PgdA/CDA1 family)
VTGPGTLVLLYHRVADLERDPYGLAVRPDRFARHCEILRQRCDAVPLMEVTGTPRQVVITFDDGYADNAGEAHTILEDAGLPATFFITAGRLGDRAEFWSDRLERIILGQEPGASHIDVEVAGRRLWADMRSPSARQRAHWALYWRLRPLPPAAIHATLADVEDQLQVSSVERETHRMMTVEELLQLSSSDLVTIGAHTLNHPFLATLPQEEQWNEIVGSRRHLEGLLGVAVSAFSYPYGSHDSFSDLTTRLVREAGYTAACTVTGGLAGPSYDRFLIPRNAVGDWKADTFDQWLNRWLRHLQ